MKVQLLTRRTDHGLLSPDAFAEREDGYRAGVDLLALDEAGWAAQAASMPRLSESERAEVLQAAMLAAQSNVVLSRAATPAPDPTYVEKRRREYPSFADQFEMIYKAAKAGDPGLTEFVAALDAVRAKYPKD